MGGVVGGGILPSEYKQIPGIKNSSTAYLPVLQINTGVRYELEIEASAISTSTGAFGRNAKAHNKEILVFYSSSTQCYLNGGFRVSSFSLNTRYKIVVDLAMESEYAKMYIDDTLVRQTGINIEAGADMFLFNDSSRGGTVKGILYSFRGYQNGELVQDYVPAKRKADGKVGVYDIVNNEFITSPNGVDFVEP